MDSLKILWLKDTYPCSYYLSKEARTRIQFDTRYWSSKDIKIFFDDLSYGDNRTYELCIFKTGKRSLAASEKRYKKWLEVQPLGRCLFEISQSKEPTLI